MLTTETFLALYYLGYGFVIFLGWACLTDSSSGPLTSARTRRLRRGVIGLAVLGVVHPAFALAGRDLASQLGRPDGPPPPGAAVTELVSTWGVAVSCTLAAGVIASRLSVFDEAPFLRQVGAGLPFS